MNLSEIKETLFNPYTSFTMLVLPVLVVIGIMILLHPLKETDEPNLRRPNK